MDSSDAVNCAACTSARGDLSYAVTKQLATVARNSPALTRHAKRDDPAGVSAGGASGEGIGEGIAERDGESLESWGELGIEGPYVGV